MTTVPQMRCAVPFFFRLRALDEVDCRLSVSFTAQVNITYRIVHCKGNQPLAVYGSHLCEADTDCYMRGVNECRNDGRRGATERMMNVRCSRNRN